MFILDSLMISGIQWAIKTVITAAEAEMNDDSALRDQLLAAEMQREMGEISDEEYREIEGDLLARIREIKQRREGTGPLGFEARSIETGEGDSFTIEAEMSGDFHGPADQSERPERPVDSDAPPARAGGEPEAAPGPPIRTTRASRAPRTSRTSRASRTARTPRTPRTKQ
jgi:hypothetical protein